MATFGLISASARKQIEANFHTIRRCTVMAKEKSCDVLCFPECFLTGYFPKEADTFAIHVSSPYFTKLQELAATSQIDLLVGFMERSGQDIFITHGMFLRSGEYHFYRKTHLGSRESNVFTPGDRLDVFRLSCGICIGFQLCVETHFPEISQTLSLRGAQIIFAPHAVPRVSGNRKKIWETMIPARSYDNRVYFACCNQWDEEKFGGGTLVTAPNGEVVDSCYLEQEHLLTFTVNEEELKAPHTYPYYFPIKRRPHLYETTVTNADIPPTPETFIR